MPVMDGLEASSKITEMQSKFQEGKIKTPIVAITANIMSNDLELYKACGMSDCIGKPFTANELWRTLSKFLSIKGREKVNKQEQASMEEKMKHQLKVVFVKENQTTYAEFSQSLQEDDISKAHRISHTIKGTAGQIDETRLQSAAAAVENMLSNKNSDIDKGLLSVFEAELSATLAKLEPLLSEDVEEADVPENEEGREESGDGTASELKSEGVGGLFEELLQLLENSDTDCQKLLPQIRAVPDTAQLVKQIEDYEFSHACDTLRELKKEMGYG